MHKVLALQCALIALVAGVLTPWLGTRGFVSAVLGGVAYALPNAVFVISLKLRLAAQGGGASGATFFVGEMCKVLATIALLALAHRWFDVHWLALLAGLFAALKANLFSFLLKT